MSINYINSNISYMCQPKMRAIIVFVFLNQYTAIKNKDNDNVEFYSRVKGFIEDT